MRRGDTVNTGSLLGENRLGGRNCMFPENQEYEWRENPKSSEGGKSI